MSQNLHGNEIVGSTPVGEQTFGGNRDPLEEFFRMCRSCEVPLDPKFANWFKPKGNEPQNKVPEHTTPYCPWNDPVD